MPEVEERRTLGRRDVLKAAAGAVAAIMLQPGWIASAKAQTSVAKADPRFPFVDCISELTIPTTDTPGASALGVPVFVLLALDQRLSGLAPEILPILQRELDRAAGGSFLAKPSHDQSKILGALDTAAYAAPARANTPTYAWRKIKAAIVAGYYTSEVGASKELIYEPVPGHGGNITLEPNYRARSNEGFQGGFNNVKL